MTSTKKSSDPTVEAKGDDELNHGKFIANFDSDGAFKKLESQLKKVARELNVEIRKRQAVENALQATVALLETENESLKKKLEREWRPPLVLFAGLSILGIVTLALMGVYFTTQFFVTSELSKRLDDLTARVVAAERPLHGIESNLTSIAEDVNSRVTGAIDNVQAKLKSAQTKMDDAIDNVQGELATAQAKVDSELQRLQTGEQSSQSKIEKAIERIQADEKSSQVKIDEAIKQIQLELNTSQTKIDGS